MRPRACGHRVLAYVGRNAGVVCVRCRRTWRRVRKLIGPTSITRLVSGGA